MFDEYIGKHLTRRHKAIGLKYARKHGYPELIGPHSYGIMLTTAKRTLLSSVSGLNADLCMMRRANLFLEEISRR